MFSDLEKNIINFLKENFNKSYSLKELSLTFGLWKTTVFYWLKKLIKEWVVLENKKSIKIITYSLASNKDINNFIERKTKFYKEIFVQKNLNKKQKLVFVWHYKLENFQLEKLKEKFEIITFKDSPLYLTKEIFISRTKEADIVVIFDFLQIDEEIFEKCKNLKTIISWYLDTSNIDSEIAKKYWVKIFSLKYENNYKKSARREYVFASLFYLLRPIFNAHLDVKVGRFDFRNLNSGEISGKTIWIVWIKYNTLELVSIFRMFWANIVVSNPDNLKIPASNFGLKKYYNLQDTFSLSDVIIFSEEYNSEINIDKYLSQDNIPEYFLILSYNISFSLDKMRELVLNKKIKWLFIDYFNDVVDIYNDFLNSEYKKIYNLPNVVITPEIWFYTDNSMKENKKQVYDILLKI